MLSRVLATVAAVMALTVIPGVAAATTYVISIPGVIDTTNGAPSVVGLTVGPVTLNATFDDRYVFQWGDNGYKVMASYPACGFGGCRPDLGPGPLSSFSIDTAATHWFVFGDTCNGLCAFAVIDLSTTTHLTYAGPEIVFTDSQVLSVNNVYLFGIGPGQPNVFAPVTFNNAFSISENVAPGPKPCGPPNCATFSGHWNLAAATIQVLSVPEPATWLTMILGFGGVGLALRRRRQMGMSSSL